MAHLGKLNRMVILMVCMCFFSIKAHATSGSVVFVILTHVRNEEDNELWKRCYASIRQFYPEFPIVIIDDNSKNFFSKKKLHKTSIVKSEYPGAGELLPYYYFLKYKWADKMVFLHDSMFLKRRFSDFELNREVKFHWCFSEHIYDDNVRIDRLFGFLKEADDLISYNYQKSLWDGCFGVTSVIDLNLLKKLENKYALTSSLINKIKSREDRMALERIFAIIMFKEKYVTRSNCSNFGSILEYPRGWQDVDDNFLEYLKITYPGAILKTWHGR